MKPEQDPVVVDLASRRKQALLAAKAATRKTARPAGHEPLLGSRPKAGLILALVAAVAVALWLAAAFF